MLIGTMQPLSLVVVDVALSSYSGLYSTALSQISD